MSLATTVEAPPDRIEPAFASRLLLWSIAGFTVVMLIWAALSQVDETAVAPGRVIPSRQLQVVSNLEGGVIADVLVHPGDRVSAGQLLMRLDPATATSDFSKTSATTQALAARIARLEGEVAGHAPAFPAGSMPPPLPPNARSTARGWPISRRRLRPKPPRPTARCATSTRRRANSRRGARRARRPKREAMLIAPLVEKGIEPRIALDRARSTLAQAQSAEAGAADAVNRARAAVAEARAGQRSAAGKFRSQSVDALAQARAEMASRSAELPALKGRLARTELRAPIAGIVNRVLVTTVGGSVRPGEPLVEVVPAGDTLVIDADVKPADIAFIHPGQRATVKLTAYDSSIYGHLDGKVERISPDAVVNERTGESHFQVRVRTDQAALKSPDGMALPVGAGMIAESASSATSDRCCRTS